jgi:hypothetical protein
LPKEVVIGKLNELVRGWTGYYYYGNCSRDLKKIKNFLSAKEGGNETWKGLKGSDQTNNLK